MNVPTIYNAQLSINNSIVYRSLPIDHCDVENIGVEPMTSCVQGRRSSQLS